MRVDAGGFAIPENEPLRAERSANGVYRFPIYREQYEYFHGRPLDLASDLNKESHRPDGTQTGLWGHR